LLGIPLAAAFAEAPTDVKRLMMEMMRQQHESMMEQMAAMLPPEPVPMPAPRIAPSPPPRRAPIFYEPTKESLPNGTEVELLATLFVAVNGADRANALQYAVNAEAPEIALNTRVWRGHHRRQALSTQRATCAASTSPPHSTSRSTRPS
jgi:hypothetical protein